MIAESQPPVPATTLVAIFEETARRQGGRTAALVKQDGRWQEVTWEALAADGRALADGLASLGIDPGDRVAILGNTSMDWIRADLGVMGAAAVEVPIYQSDTPQECAFLLRDSGAKLVICDSRAQATKILSIRAELPLLQGLVCFQPGGQPPFEQTLEEVMARGRRYRAAHPEAHAVRLAAIDRDGPCCVIYTAGTTGEPKGVVLGHRNWTYEAEAIQALGVLRADDLLLFFLPLAHVFAKVIEACWFQGGFQMAFAESVDRLLDDAAEVRPTVLPMVPRIFEKAYAAVLQRGHQARGLNGLVFKAGMAAFERHVEAKLSADEQASLGLFLARRLLFPKLAKSLRERFGDRLRFFVSGSAPLNPKIAYFFQEMGLTILEGYGLTETSAATCVNLPGRVKIGTVGPPLPGTELKLADDGEIFVRGGGVFQGYYRRPEATAEVLKDGWFATGDIGAIDEEGYLKITDRKKDIIATAGGKKVPPQNLENALQTEPLIGHALVHGDGRKFLSALITLNPQAARIWAEAHGSRARSLAELALDPAVRGAVQRAVDALNLKLPSYSTIKRFEILDHEFTVEGGQLTAKLSVRRKLLSQKYRASLDRFYAE